MASNPESTGRSVPAVGWVLTDLLHKHREALRDGKWARRQLLDELIADLEAEYPFETAAHRAALTGCIFDDGAKA